MPKCPVCGKIATKEMGVQFPSDSAKFVRYCLQLKLNPKTTNKKTIICFEHFNPKDLIKERDKIVGVAQMALPRLSRLTLDQLLEKNVGMPTSAAVSSLPQNVASASVPSARQSVFSSPAQSHHSSVGVGSLHENNRQHDFPLVQNAANLHEMPRQCLQTHGQQNGVHSVNTDNLADIAKQTLVLFRDVSDPFDNQKAVSDWLCHSFDLSPNSIREISSSSKVANSQVFFVVFAEIGTAANILKMSKSERKSHQTILSSAVDFLQSNSPDKSASSAISDENVWRNLAAAMVPAYNNLMAAASSQLHHQTSHSNLTAASTARDKSHTTERNSAVDEASLQTIMSQIDKIIRQGNTF